MSAYGLETKTVGASPGGTIRVAFFLSDLDAGGAQRTIINIVKGLPPGRIIPILITGRSDGGARAWLDPAYPLIDLGCARMRDTLWRLRATLLRDPPDILMATMVDANIVASLATALAKRPPGLILRETNSHRARGDLGRLRRAAVAWTYPYADAIVALSRGVAEELVQDYALDSSRVVTIHNPVDIESWARRTEAARKASPPWGEFGTGAPVLLGVGRLIEQKGFDLLLRALAACQQGGRRAHLVLVGEGPERAKLSALAEKLGLSDRLLMPGFAPDPATWYAHSDLFMLPSRWEGFGHVIVEAMACGLPVIAFDCPYGPADILSNRQGGILIGPNDVNGLAQAIDRILAAPDERESLKASGRRSIERFALARIAAQYADLIEKVADSRTTQQPRLLSRRGKEADSS